MIISKGVIIKDSAPSVNNDSVEGFFYKFIWIDSNDDNKVYICKDASSAAANWQVAEISKGMIVNI